MEFRNIFREKLIKRDYLILSDRTVKILAPEFDKIRLVEAAELWTFKREKRIYEVADVLNYCILMLDSLDIEEIVLNKMKNNAVKYPATCKI